MTRTTNHSFGALAAVLLAVGLAALVLMAFAASAADAQSSEGRQLAQAKDEGTDQVEDEGTGQAEDEGTNPSVRPFTPLKYVMADSKHPSNGGNVKAVAQCPNFYMAISGGFDLHVDNTPWTIRASRPATPEEANSETAWVVQAASPGFTVRPFTAYAVCVHESFVPRGDSLYYASSSVDLPPDTQTKELTPDCRASHQAIGGGFALDTSYIGMNNYIRLVRSQPNPGGDFRSWIVRARNSSKIDGGGWIDAKLSAYSVCIRKDLVKDLQFKDHPESSNKGYINSNTPRCPENTYLLSGGGGAAVLDSNMLRWSHIRPGGGSEADPPKSWSAGAKDLRPLRPSGYTVHAHALCGRLGSKSLGSADGEKASGKNPGWGDGEGGGRSKEGGEA